MGINIILSGATGMVGEGVLLESLDNSGVNSVLAVGRRSRDITHPKLTELIHGDLGRLSPARDKLTGYDACFFCAGVSSVGKKEDEYTKLTYDMTIHFAEVFKEANPGKYLTFCYVSGYGTDSSAARRSMWARVKGRTENKLLEVFEDGGYMFRPGYMRPSKGQNNTLKFYFGWQVIYPVMKLLIPRFTCTLSNLGRAMINCAIQKLAKHVLEVRDIVKMSSAK